MGKNIAKLTVLKSIGQTIIFLFWLRKNRLNKYQVCLNIVLKKQKMFLFLKRNSRKVIGFDRIFEDSYYIKPKLFASSGKTLCCFCNMRGPIIKKNKIRRLTLIVQLRNSLTPAYPYWSSKNNLTLPQASLLSAHFR
jgi:hypothetical protein